MKSKIFTKFLCLALCLVTIFCSGGVSCMHWDPSYLGNDPKDMQRLIEIMQKRKEEAQTFIPQCTDYTLKIALGNIYTEKELFEQQGFYPYYDYFLDTRYDWRIRDSSEFQILEYSYDDEGKSSWSIVFTIPLDSVYKHNSFHFDIWGGGDLVAFDNRFFLITETLDDHHNIFQQKAQALYLVDFENEQLLYCGCALEFYDLFIPGNRKEAVYLNDLFYKIEKNTGENGNEKNS